MQKKIYYAGLCLQGKERPRNEDNLWCSGVMRLPYQAELPLFTGCVRPGPGARFCVLDGISSLKDGDTASLIAAEAFGQDPFFDRNPAPEEAAFFCRRLNRRILSFSELHSGMFMGTTIASLYFTMEGIFGFNLGDSRCYRSSGGMLFQISRDHDRVVPVSGRHCLTQYLGIPEESFLLEPFFYQASYQTGDRYLLCTNGLSRYTDHRAISYILRQKKPPEVLADKLQNLAGASGQRDDLTMILFSIE